MLNEKKRRTIPATLRHRLAAGGREGRLCKCSKAVAFLRNQWAGRTSPGVAALVVSGRTCTSQHRRLQAVV